MALDWALVFCPYALIAFLSHVMFALANNNSSTDQNNLDDK